MLIATREETIIHPWLHQAQIRKQPEGAHLGSDRGRHNPSLWLSWPPHDPWLLPPKQLPPTHTHTPILELWVPRPSWQGQLHLCCASLVAREDSLGVPVPSPRPDYHSFTLKIFFVVFSMQNFPPSAASWQDVGNISLLP